MLSVIAFKAKISIGIAKLNHFAGYLKININYNFITLNLLCNKVINSKN